MSYVGGKARGAAHILAVLNDPRFDGYDYLEPFVGMGHVLRRVVNKRRYAASDAEPLVVALLRGVQANARWMCGRACTRQVPALLHSLRA